MNLRDQLKKSLEEQIIFIAGNHEPTYLAGFLTSKILRLADYVAEDKLPELIVSIHSQTAVLKKNAKKA